MVSEVDICNLALGRIKQGKIDALDEVSAEAEECNRLFELSRDFVLADFPWRVNTTIQTLAELTNDREDDWAYKYQRPTCLRVRSLLPETGRQRQRKRIPFEATAAGIYCNVQYARGVILTRETDVTLYSPALISCIAWHLASELIPCLEGVEFTIQWAERKYQAAKNNAWATDASEQVTNDDDADECGGSGELPVMIACRE